jgi:D-alanyl-D-alanine carboxypeptidase
VRIALAVVAVCGAFAAVALAVAPPHGTSGDDKLTGTKHADVLKGLAGNDKLLGGRGSDRLIGGKGNDKLLGGPGRDEFNMEAGVQLSAPGDDVINARDGGKDEINCGAGHDIATVDASEDGVYDCEEVREP